MAEWTLLNPPAFQGKNNESGLGTRNVLTNVTDNDEATTSFLSNPSSPLFLLLSRTTPATVTLSNALDNSVIYKIRDTGRGTLSSKPDYEVFRTTGGSDLFVGSVRFGRKTEVKMQTSGRKFEGDGVERFELDGRKFGWKVSHIGREKGVNKSLITDEERKKSEPKWVVVVDCFEDALGDDGDPMCSVKLFDVLPNGRIEVWDNEVKGCVTGSGKGDWNLLDELVTVGYANLEKARRKLMKSGSDPTGVGIAGLGIGAGAM